MAFIAVIETRLYGLTSEYNFKENSNKTMRFICISVCGITSYLIFCEIMSNYKLTKRNITDMKKSKCGTI